MNSNLKSCALLGVAVIATCTLLSAAEKIKLVRSADIGQSVVLTGSLGVPLGQYMTLEGKRLEEQGAVKGGNRTLLVEKLNGTKLKSPTPVNVGKILPPDQTIILYGYEWGGYIGAPHDPSGRVKSYPQAGWQFRVSFNLVEVLGPPELKESLKATEDAGGFSRPGPPAPSPPAQSHSEGMKE